MSDRPYEKPKLTDAGRVIDLGAWATDPDAHLLRVCIEREINALRETCSEDQGDPDGKPGTVGHEQQVRLRALLGRVVRTPEPVPPVPGEGQPLRVIEIAATDVRVGDWMLLAAQEPIWHLCKRPGAPGGHGETGLRSTQRVLVARDEEFVPRRLRTRDGFRCNYVAEAIGSDAELCHCDGAAHPYDPFGGSCGASPAPALPVGGEGAWADAVDALESAAEIDVTNRADVEGDPNCPPVLGLDGHETLSRLALAGWGVVRGTPPVGGEGEAVAAALTEVRDEIEAARASHLERTVDALPGMRSVSLTRATTLAMVVALLERRLVDLVMPPATPAPVPGDGEGREADQWLADDIERLQADIDLHPESAQADVLRGQQVYAKVILRRLRGAA